jgi:hypothetical protein
VETKEENPQSLLPAICSKILEATLFTINDTANISVAQPDSRVDDIHTRLKILFMSFAASSKVVYPISEAGEVCPGARRFAWKRST